MEIERGDPLSNETRKHRLGLFSTNKKEQILVECQARINKHEFQAAYDRRSLLKLSEIIESQQEELHCAQAEELQRYQQLLHAQSLQQKLELREAHQRSLTEMEELRKFQSSTFDTIARRKSVEDQNTFMELSGRIQELQNEINCMNDSKEFQDAESIRSGNSHVTSRPVSFPRHPIPEGMLSRSFGVPATKNCRQAFGTRMVYRETFLQIQMRLHQHLILKKCINGVHRWPGGWGPQGRSLTGGGGLARVPNLRVCEYPLNSGVAHAGRKDELTSCRGTVQSSSETQRRKSRAARKGKWPPYGDDSPHLPWKCA